MGNRRFDLFGAFFAHPDFAFIDFDSSVGVVDVDRVHEVLLVSRSSTELLLEQLLVVPPLLELFERVLVEVVLSDFFGSV